MGGQFGLPALAIKPQEQPDLLGEVGKVAQLKNMIQQGQIGQISLQQQKQQLADQQAATAAMHDWDGKDIQQLPTLMLKHGASATAVIGMKQHIVEQQAKLSGIAKDDAETGKNQIATLAAKNNLALGQLKTLDGVPDDQLGQRLIGVTQDLANSGLLDPQHVQTVQQLAQLPPPQLRQQLSIFGKSLQSQKEQFDQLQEQIRTQAQAQKDVAQGQEAALGAQQKQMQIAGTSPTGLTAEQQLQAKQRQQQIGIEGGRLAEEKRHNQVAEGGEPSNIPAGVTGEDALKLMNPMHAAAVKMVGDGKVDLPTMMARLPAGARQTFLSDVNAYNPTYSQSTYGVEKKVEQKFTSGNVSDQLMAIGTAREHMKTFSRLADALKNGDMQALNQIGNALGIQFGSDKATNFKIAAQAFGGEVGRAFEGAGVVAGERKEAENNFNAAMANGQFKGAINTVDELLAGKQRSAKQAYDSARQGKPNFGNQSTPSAPTNDFFSRFQGKPR